VILEAANICNLGINDYIGKEFECKCGKKHRVDIAKIVIGKGALQQIPSILQEFRCKRVLIVADTNTDQAVGQNVAQLVQNAGFSLESLVYERDGDLVPDEEAIGQLLVNVDSNTDLIIAVGSGVINDLAKYVSSRLRIPYIIVASAPSMDGFASDVSALILDGLKTSPSAQPAKAIIGDLDVMRNAPLEMIRAGLGDMLGKYSSLKDWKIASILTGEYYCETVAAMVRLSVQKCIDHIHGFQNREEAAIQSLMEGLVLSGIAMSFVGNSRPASGSEHHISHFWEMAFLQRGKSAVLHGIKVGITALAASQVANLLTTQEIDFECATKKNFRFAEPEWEQAVNRLFQKAAPVVLKQCRENNRNSETERIKRVAAVKSHWPEIAAVLREQPAAAELKNILTTVGAPFNPKEIGVDSELVFDSIIYAKEIRNRYTVLQLAWDLGLLEDYATAIKDYFETL